MFIIFKDGFTLLVMGYTGPEAMRFKLAYIEAFNALETELQRQREGALPPADALAPSQQAQLKALVDAKVGMLPKEHQRKGYGEVWPLRPPLRDRQVHATAAGEDGRGRGVFDRAGT